MNEIIKIEPVKAIDVNRTSLTYFIGQLITKAALIAGFTLTDEAHKVMLECVPKDIQTRYKLLELPEIETIFNDGSRGIYGDFYGISTLTINKWIKHYLDSGAHNDYLANKVKELKPLLEEKTQPTQQEIDDIIRAGVVTCYENYLKTGIVIDYGSPKVNWLLEKGIITPTKEEREDYKQQAREQLESNARDKKESISRIERMEAKKEIEEMITMLDSDSKIQSLAKNICLRDWFEKITEEKLDINDLIKR